MIPNNHFTRKRVTTRTRSVIEAEVNEADWLELNALCRRPVETPRAKMTREEIRHWLSQPEGQRPNTGRPAGPIKHGTAQAYRRHTCRCEVCVTWYRAENRAYAARRNSAQVGKEHSR